MHPLTTPAQAPPLPHAETLTGLLRFACAVVILLIGALLIRAWRERHARAELDRRHARAQDRADRKLAQWHARTPGSSVTNVRVVHPHDVAIDASGRRFTLAHDDGRVIWLDDQDEPDVVELTHAHARSCAHLSALDVADGLRCIVAGCTPVAG